MLETARTATPAFGAVIVHAVLPSSVYTHVVDVAIARGILVVIYPQSARIAALAGLVEPVVFAVFPEVKIVAELVVCEPAFFLGCIASRRIEPDSACAHHVEVLGAIHRDVECGFAGVRLFRVANVGNVATGFGLDIGPAAI